MSQVDVLEDAESLARVYTNLLVPSFPAAELVTLAEIVGGTRSQVTSVVCLRQEGEEAAVAVADHDPASGVTLLSYLASHPAHRGRGHGGALLDAALALWRERWRPTLLVGEIDDPARHASSLAFGDPQRRLSFYSRHGASLLELPYFQPAVADGLGRVPHMLLIAWPDDERQPLPHRLVDVGPLRIFLSVYTDDGAEDVPGADRLALLAALDAPGGVGVRKL